MSYLSMIKASCGGNDNTSSKRVTMYHFVFIFIFMVLIQASFTLILIYKWANAANGVKFEIYSVFPAEIWYCVTGIITGLAGINGYISGKKSKEEPIVSDNQEEQIN